MLYSLHMNKSKNMKTFRSHLNEMLKDPEFKKEYDALEPEFALIRQSIEKRIQKELSQADLAKKMGTKQSAISRFESGSYHPTMNFMNKVATALGLKLKVTFEEPKKSGKAGSGFAGKKII